jgi:hypothetical protein
VFILCAVIGILKAVMDALAFEKNGNASIFAVDENKKLSYWQIYFTFNRISYQNKYSDIKKLTPRFPGSTTIFVFITDLWHTCQFLILKLFVIAIIIYTPYFHPLVDALIMLTIISLLFHITYNYLL